MSSSESVEGGGEATELRPSSDDGAVDDGGDRRYQIFVLDSALRPLSIDRHAPAPMLIGTSPIASLKLDDPSVSRRHLSMEMDERGGLRVIDLGSTNGSFINGIRTKDVVLMGGETIRIGGTTLRIELIKDEPPPRPFPTKTAESKSKSKSAAAAVASFGQMVGASTVMRRLYPLCERIAASDVPVIIEGETGTGKEVLAEALHEKSARAPKPFVVFDCTAVPPELFESALFGHEKGAFTGAVSTRKGAFEQASGGTLFIDEIGDLSLTLQPKFLRALERSEVQRVGADHFTKLDVRIIAATRRDLDQEVAAGRFRDDLFFRLSVTRVVLPPLRNRTGDLAVLARHFWRMLGGRTQPFPEDFLTKMAAYPWPGNVRELRNVIARRLAIGDLDQHQGAQMDDEPAAEPSSNNLIDAILARDLPLTIARQELNEGFLRLYVERVLERHGGNVRKAAAASGIARRYFQVIRARQK